MIIKEIKGIGPKSLELLKKLNINTVEDLISYYPFKYDVLKKTFLYDNKSVEKTHIELSVFSLYSKR